MSRFQKAFSVTILAVLILGLTALSATPVALAGVGAKPSCPQTCPPTKKIHGYPCKFVGCDPITGACMYAC